MTVSKSIAQVLGVRQGREPREPEPGSWAPWLRGCLVPCLPCSLLVPWPWSQGAEEPGSKGTKEPGSRQPEWAWSRSRTPPRDRALGNGAGPGAYGAAFFDRPVDRTGFHTVKYDLRGVIFGAEAADAVPLWVADMDLPCATEITDALRQRTEHPTFGYTLQPSAIWQAAHAWLREEHGWEVPTDAFVFSASVVTAAAAALWAFTAPGDKVLLMTPLYEPLMKVVTGAGRTLRKHELTLVDGRYCIERQRLEQDLKGCKMMLFCNPHNPGGRVWEATELRMVAELCKQEGAMIVSDEIWADWSLFGQKYRPMQLEAAEGQDVITLMAPTKTWNLAGLHCSYLVIPNERLRQRYLETVSYAFMTFGSTFATEALLAAYRQGRPWLLGVRSYIEASLLHCESVLRKRCAPEIVPLRPQATYLLWLDCSGLGLADPARFLKEEAGVILSPGAEFGGESTARFVRMNVATNRAALDRALELIAAAVVRLRAGARPAWASQALGA